MPHSTPPRPIAPRAEAFRRRVLLRAGGCAAWIGIGLLALATPNAFAGTETTREGAEALASLDAILASFQTRMSAELDPGQDLAMNETLNDTTQQHVDAMAVRHDTDAYMSRQIDERIDRDLMVLTDEFRTTALASAREGGDEAGSAQLADAQASDPMRMESGSLELGRTTLARVSNRHVSLRHRFAKPFEEAPRVTLGVRAVQLPNGEHAQIGLRIVDVDTTGFDYEVQTWGDPTVGDLTADWVAYSESGERSTPASR